MTFSEILIRERKSRGLSQEDLAGMVNVSRQAVSKWETGDAMPDLPKLLALADALNISLDELCGREVQPPQSEPTVPPPQKRVRVLPIVCFLLCTLLAAAVVLLLSLSDSTVPTYSALSTTEEFSVSGLGFHGKSDVLVAYQFTPSISGEGLSYQIVFTDYQGNSYPIDVPCNGGVCSGEATLEGGYMGYAVTVCVTDGILNRNLAVANNLNFSQGHASWTPLDPA